MLRLSTMEPYRKPVWVLTLLSCLLVFSGGCQSFPRFCGFLRGNESVEASIPSRPTYRTFVSPLFESHPPQRVVILESGPTPGSYGETRKLIVELASQIRAAGRFEVVVPDEERLHFHPDNILNGEYDEREIAAISRRYNADAIALVRVNELQSFAPMRISATMAIVNSHESVVVFGVDGTWDTSRLATMNEFTAFAENRGDWIPNESPSSAIYVQSPTLLMSFAASQMTEALVR